jgi:hypothetical protein
MNGGTLYLMTLRKNFMKMRKKFLFLTISYIWVTNWINNVSEELNLTVEELL